jgi:hypothetical protein
MFERYNIKTERLKMKTSKKIHHEYIYTKRFSMVVLIRQIRFKTETIGVKKGHHTTWKKTKQLEQCAPVHT